MKALATWSPAPYLNVTAVEREASRWLVTVYSRERACCPVCGVQSSSRHSFYSRTLGDLSAQGTPVTIRVRVGRWRCRNERCGRRIFAERLDILCLHGTNLSWVQKPRRHEPTSGVAKSRVTASGRVHIDLDQAGSGIGRRPTTSEMRLSTYPRDRPVSLRMITPSRRNSWLCSSGRTFAQRALHAEEVLLTAAEIFPHVRGPRYLIAVRND